MSFQIYATVTTAPREVPTLGRCVASLIDCGFDPVIHAEPRSYPTGCHTIWNQKRLGAWHNWRESVLTALSSESPLILTIQDDIVVHPDTRRFLASIPFPEDAGFISAYCPSHYAVKGSRGERPAGLHKFEVPTIYGACALLFQWETLHRMSQTETFNSWLGMKPASNPIVEFEKRKQHPEIIKHVDVAITKILRELKLYPYYLVPSLSQHIAVDSTLGHAPSTGRRKAGRLVDFSKPLVEQIKL